MPPRPSSPSMRKRPTNASGASGGGSARVVGGDNGGGVDVASQASVFGSGGCDMAVVRKRSVGVRKAAPTLYRRPPRRTRGRVVAPPTRIPRAGAELAECSPRPYSQAQKRNGRGDGSQQ